MGTGAFRAYPNKNEAAGGTCIVGAIGALDTGRVMIHLNCPNCGRRGIVPNSKIYTRLHCSKCDAVFHVEHNGQVQLGEPGGKSKRKLGDPDQPLTPTETEEEGFTAADFVERMPTGILVGLVVFVLAALAWAIRAYLVSGKAS